MSARRHAFAHALQRNLGAYLKDARLERGISQEQLALEVELTQASISNYESGRHDVPTSVRISLCAALGISAAEIALRLLEWASEYEETVRRHPVRDR